VSSPLHQRVSRRPQLRSLLDQQRTLGNRAVLRLIGVEPEAPEPEEPASPPVAPQPPPPEPDPPPPPKRRWLLGIGVLVLLAVLETLRRWFAL
jgi:hypothetical protein